MKEMGGIGRWALILLLLGNVYGGFAQDANTARAQHIYELFVAGQGDSIHAALNRELQEKLAPALFNDSFRQAEKMFGKSISKGEWKTDSAQGITIYYSDVEFERYNLRFLVAFDADGALNTIRLVPAPAVSTAQPVAYDKTKMDERDITLGHKGIIIGKGGEMLKKIGSAARFEIERMMDMQVNLKLWVKVKKEWRDNDLLMKNYGYDEKALKK